MVGTGGGVTSREPPRPSPAYAYSPKQIAWGVDFDDFEHSTTCANCRHCVKPPAQRRSLTRDVACRAGVSYGGRHPGAGFFCGLWQFNKTREASRAATVTR